MNKFALSDLFISTDGAVINEIPTKQTTADFLTIFRVLLTFLCRQIELGSDGIILTDSRSTENYVLRDEARDERQKEVREVNFF